MRKVVKLISVIIVICILSACSLGKTDKFVRSWDDKSILVEVTHSGDKVTDMTVTLKLNIPTDEPTGLAKKYMEEKLEDLKKEYEEKDLNLSTDVSDKDVSMTLSFDATDIEKFDKESYADITGISGIYEDDHISFDKVKNKLLDKGYSEK